MAKTVKVAMVGSGGMANAHLPGLKSMPGVEVVGFCDTVLERAQGLADAHGGQAFKDPAKMLDAVAPDCCYVLLPPFAHGKAEFACIERGIPFFVEKPINKNWKQACQIAEGVADKSLLTSAGYMNRYRAGIQQARKLLARDPAVYVWGGWIGGKPNPNPAAPITVWWVRKAMSGGQFVEQVTHTVDLVRFLCGEAVEVSAFAANGFNKGIATYDIDDAMTVNIQFANGGVCNLVSCCASNARGGVSLDVYATNIAFEFRGWEHTCKVFRASKDVEEIPGEGDIFAVEDAAFIKAVRAGNDKGVLCSYGDALKTLEISIAANLSADKGKTVKLGTM
jgi:myo-inositol 2-dehydrogenase / D-chiro-inositol 1-dehydrogenase